MKKYCKLSSAAVVIGAWKVKSYGHSIRWKKHQGMLTYVSNHTNCLFPFTQRGQNNVKKIEDYLPY